MANLPAESTITGAATGIAKIIGDPVLIVLTIVIIGLFFLLYTLLKSIDKKEKLYQGTIDELTKELHDNSQTLARLGTLIEVLVHGRSTT